MVTDENVLADPRFAFQAVTTSLFAVGGARAWLDARAAAPGAASIATDVTVPWESASASQTELDLAFAPFELIAIANRADLTTEDQPPEIRFVYGLIEGGERLPVTVNVEVDLPTSETAREWATRWHRLGTLRGDAYTDGLASLVVAALAAPSRGQIRTEDARATPATLVQFDLGRGPIAVSPLTNQPSPNGSPAALAAFVSANEPLLAADQEVVPTSLLAASIQAAPPKYVLSGVSPELTTTFERQTCAGCHSEVPTIDGTFHVSPLRRGHDALSAFLGTTADPASELSRRAEVSRALLCE